MSTWMYYTKVSWIMHRQDQMGMGKKQE